jgi:hypothetical protein
MRRDPAAAISRDDGQPIRPGPGRPRLELDVERRGGAYLRETRGVAAQRDVATGDGVADAIALRIPQLAVHAEIGPILVADGHEPQRPGRDGDRDLQPALLDDGLSAKPRPYKRARRP